MGSVRQPVCPAAAAAKGGDARQRRFVRCAAVCSDGLVCRNRRNGRRCAAGRLKKRGFVRGSGEVGRI
ncbi:MULTISPECIES: hypothetical protein [unclassified Neisseria]|uniref:hypothetical protein n=1 Tax=unclassified Neisseria TaxID=2623750 RepID=UPI001072305D|nr:MULTISPECIES: hypothetical protein [unclassified Neisseria]MBF0803259.1 hypothetical protein [Neisseria sp. 19428wB4_WF04]TFU44098.1 hypothetical protein E4T99_02625 [Neisseria sp. WF04]